MHTIGPALVSNNVRALKPNVEPGPDIAGYYPLISHIQAGNWTVLADNFQPGDAEKWIASGHNLGPHGYMLRVKGDSMKDPGGEFSFTEGMILHVNADLVPMPGQFAIARRQSTLEATFKRYVMIDGEPYLSALNPDWPREQKFLKLRPGDVWCGVVITASYAHLP
jgi:SOS-response transcriptional repressor LexA